MSKDSVKTSKDSENVLQESSIEAKRDVHVGNKFKNSNNTINIFLSGGKVFLWLMPVTLIVWLMVPQEFINFLQTRSSDKQKIDKVDSLGNDHEKIDGFSPEIKPVAEDKPTSSNTIEKVIPRQRQPPSTIGITFKKTEEKLNRVLFNAFSKILAKHRLKLVNSDSGLAFDLELNCSLEYDEKTVQLNGQAYQIQAYLQANMYDPIEQKVVGSQSMDTMFTIREMESLGRGIQQWLESIDLVESLLPQ